MGISIGRAPFGSEVTAGAGTWFDDLRVAPNARTTGSNAPTFGRIQRNTGGTSNGVYAYLFDNATAGSEKEIYFGMQMPHGKLLNSVIHMHVHWCPTTAGGAGHKVRWGLEYTWANLDGAFPVTETVYADTAALGTITTALNHHLTEFVDLAPPANENVSSIFQARIFRDSANAGDTATVTAAMLFLDCHVEMDRLGSRDEFAQ